ncbi:hypothetical protein BDR22DRAFT_178482 [Usnea florida]
MVYCRVPSIRLWGQYSTVSCGTLQFVLHVYILVALRVSNQPLLDSSLEDQWGFAQILALVMLGSTLLECARSLEAPSHSTHALRASHSRSIMRNLRNLEVTILLSLHDIREMRFAPSGPGYSLRILTLNQRPSLARDLLAALQGAICQGEEGAAATAIFLVFSAS